MEKIYYDYYESPVGKLELTGTDNSLLELKFDAVEKNEYETCDYLKKCMQQLNEYFNGEQREFTLNLDPDGTEFQKRVWLDLLKIQFGKTVSYMEVTKRLGDVKAIRAVANANGQNKIPIIIPCHRVIGSDGKLTGYGGGIWRKEWLLKHERKHSNVETQMDLF